MATSFESTELGIWSLATAVNSFPDSRQLQRASPDVDELSDIERLTSSCSPDSDSLGQTNHRTPGFGSMAPECYPARIPDIELDYTDTVHSSGQHNWPKYRKLNSFNGHISDAECFVGDDVTDPTCDVIASTDGLVRHQNGGHPSNGAHETSEGIKNLNEAFASVEGFESRNNESVKESFGTSEAVEVLLGLSEGLFQNTHNNNNVFRDNHSGDTECGTDSNTTSHRARLDDVRAENVPVAEEGIPTTPAKDDVANKFHFKKAFCRKFAQSLDRPPTPELEAKTAAAETEPPEVEFKNGGSEQTFINTCVTNERRRLETRDDVTMTSRDVVVTNHDVQNDLNSSNQPRTSNEMTRKERLKLRSDSELYRNLTRAESPTESIDASDQDHYDVSESESSSDYSSESDDVESGAENTREIADEKPPNAPLKRPSFVLTKPKFSLPNNFTSMTSQRPNAGAFGFVSAFQAPKAAENFLSFAKQKLSGSRRDPRIAPGISPGSLNPGFRIKKATFTFSGQADAPKSKRLNMTSQCHIAGEGRAMSKAPLGFVAGKSKPAEFRFLSKNCKASAFRREDSAPTFGGSAREVSFEKLSSTAKENRHNLSKARYDKRRLPRPTARSPALEAQSVRSRKRDLFEPKKQISPTKRRKLIAHSGEALVQSANKSSNDSDSSVGNKSKHLKKTVEIRGSNDDFEAGFEGRNSRSFKRNLTRCGSYSTDSISSSRTPSLCDENCPKNSKKIPKISPRKKRRHKKTHRANSQEIKPKRGCLTTPRFNRCAAANLNPEPGQKDVNTPDKSHQHPHKFSPPDFNILSSISAAASLKPGPIRGELNLGYRTSKPKSQSPDVSLLNWKVGGDASELKQKRQRNKWRNMRLSMFCMGGAT